MIVVYSPAGPLGHILGNMPGRDIGGGLVAFGAIVEAVEAEWLSPARLWGRRGVEPWQGPYDTLEAVIASLGAVAGLERASYDPNGAETISGGWRYRVAWSGELPPSRFGP